MRSLKNATGRGSSLTLCSMGMNRRAIVLKQALLVDCKTIDHFVVLGDETMKLRRARINLTEKCGGMRP
jgi:hypothetical protein